MKIAHNLMDLTGQEVAGVLVLERAGRNRSGHALWRCRRLADSQEVLRSGPYLQKLAKGPEYQVWDSMVLRCCRPKSTEQVCSRWLESFENFCTDMGPKPSPEHRLVRVDRQKGYESTNCCWR